MGSENGKPVLTQDQIDYLVESTEFDASGVREFFESFLEDHPDGKVTKEGFRKMISEAHPEEHLDKIERYFFRVYDTNNDGHIDFVEFLMAMYILSNGTPTERLERIFRIFDVNRDGTITKEQFTRLVKEMYKLLFDSNPEQASEDLVAKSAFAEMDKNEDGKVTTEEFVSACLAEEEFSKMLAVKILEQFVDDDGDDCLYGDED